MELTNYHKQIIMQSDAPKEELMKPASNAANHPKPHGGIWTSTDRGDGTSEWMDFREYEMNMPLDNIYSCLVDMEEVKLLRIDSALKEKELLEKYSLPDIPTDMEKDGLDDEAWGAKIMRYTGVVKIDWEKVIQDYDAVHYVPYYKDPEILGDNISVFSMWDIESTWWARWKFKDIQLIKENTQEASMSRELMEEELDLDGLDISLDWLDR